MPSTGAIQSISSPGMKETLNTASGVALISIVKGEEDGYVTLASVVDARISNTEGA